ncbi:hypothetical protein Q4574_11310 [Aliiglaciecola sp. 3_MG-2023]|uniref:hypothetical protein n=1 Tax=Aliiglaciecola sp. 3_MG-2023 TaxID=3062644 RepID=UPI0026E343CB|nr:hypothetical protein [Aliiglaciecola sp. 3_MG-2023]MDO6693877.1 hypothetical protein [Aliiglaciecola sp. 3_MG-2023]
MRAPRTKPKQPSAIDENLLAIHKRIGEKLLQCPDLIQQVEDKLESRFKQGLIYRGVYLDWWSILELKNDMATLISQLCVESERMNKIRRHSPFVGILTEAEREEFFRQQQNHT